MTLRINNSKPWSRDQIRAARRKNLAPIMEKRGFALRDRGGGNMETLQYPGLVVRESYWIWTDREMSGNTIDFFVKVLGASFNDAMKLISEG